MDSRRLTRAMLAAEKIRQAIVDGEYLSGERLIELSLAHRLDVSQITVREALKELEQQGWVVKKARRGVYVRGFDRAAAADLFALYSAVGGLALIALAETHGRRTLLREPRALLESARRLAAGGDRTSAVAVLFNIHSALGAASGRALTAQILDTLINQARLLEAIRQARIPGTLSELLQTLELHDALLNALEQGDADAACARLKEVITSYRRSVDDALQLG